VWLDLNHGWLQLDKGRHEEEGLVGDQGAAVLAVSQLGGALPLPQLTHGRTGAEHGAGHIHQLVAGHGGSDHSHSDWTCS